MATVKGINVKGYCDAVDTELAGMKERINELREDVKRTYGADSELFHTHERHLLELADFIDWKLHILMKACPSTGRARIRMSRVLYPWVRPRRRRGPISPAGTWAGNRFPRTTCDEGRRESFRRLFMAYRRPLPERIILH